MSRFSQAASAPDEQKVLSAELKAYLTHHQGAIEQMIEAAGEDAGQNASLRYAKAVDGLLCSLFKAALARLGDVKAASRISLAAVGSYGRGGLGYKSDLDVRLLCASKVKQAGAVAEQLLYPLWDVGLSIGHQVVTVADMVDLAKRDLPTATTLLDWRLIAGEGESTERMLKKAFGSVFSARNVSRFLETLEVQSVERQDRYGGSVYLLEPDVKNGAGGLRDLDIIQWVARARWQATKLGDLVMCDALVLSEYKELEHAARFLSRVRNLLHFYAKRRADRLSFDRQERLAVDLQYGKGGPGVERLMSEYYRHARVIVRTREALLRRARPEPRRAPKEQSLGGGLKLIGGEVALISAEALSKDPAQCIRLFNEAVKRDAALFLPSVDAVARATSDPEFCERLRQSEEATTLFRRLLREVRRSKFSDGSVLKGLHGAGVLLAMIPEFAPVVGRVHHDIYHVYTVDVHSIAAVDRLRSLCRGELAGRYPLASRLAAEIARPWVLFVATLLHDIGKDIGGRNHSQRGAEMCASICRRLGVREHDIVEIQHLVLKHLRMYHVATRRDIDDPKTIESFIEEVHGHEGLRELYLLTVADVSTTSPTALSDWSARMLEELYVATSAPLQGKPGSLAEGRAEAVRDAVRGLVTDGQDAEFVDAFLRSVPTRYLHANLPEHIIRHAGLALRAEGQPFEFEVVDSEDRYVELGFVGDDQPGLLALITAALTGAGLKVVGAQIYSRKDRLRGLRALDLFWVECSGGAKAASRLLTRVRADFGQLVSGQLNAMELVQGRKAMSRYSLRPTPSVTTVVMFDNRSGSNHTVLEITTQDRPGLLFALANQLGQAGLTISLAKINTQGDQVADVFYVCDKDGAKVTDPKRVEDLKQRIMRVINELEQDETAK